MDYEPRHYERKGKLVLGIETTSKDYNCINQLNCSSMPRYLSIEQCFRCTQEYFKQETSTSGPIKHMAFITDSDHYCILEK